MRVLVTGSRDWEDTQIIRNALAEVASLHGYENVTIVHGDCPTGADALVDEIAREWGFKVERHPANWAKYGPAAGPIRNREMVASGVDLCLAFIRNRSKGASHCKNFALKAGIETKTIRMKD